MNEKLKTILILVLVYMVSFLILFYAHSVRVHRDIGLIGEELASAYRNVYLLPRHIQNDGYATNFSGTIYFWIGSYLIPISINSQRIFKIIGMAFLPLIMILIMQKVRPKTSWPSLFISAFILATIPPLSWYSIMSAEYALDCVFAFFSLWLAFNFSWKDPLSKITANFFIIGISIIWFAHIYATCLILAIIIPLMLGVSILTEKSQAGSLNNLNTPKKFLFWVIFSFLTFTFMFWPKWYFGPYTTIFQAGGRPTLEWQSIVSSWTFMVNDLFIKPVSYLVGGDIIQPAFPLRLNGVVIIILSLLGVWVLFREKNSYSKWLLLTALASFFLGLVAGVNPGIRRIFPFVIVMVIYSGFGMEEILKFPKKIITYPIYVLWSIFLIGSFLTIFLQTYDYVSKNYKPWLQREFTYLAGKNYEETIESLIAQSQRQPLKFRGFIEFPLKKTPALEEFIKAHYFGEIYSSGKYSYDEWRQDLLLAGEMTQKEKKNLYQLYRDQASRKSIDQLFNLSQGYIFQQRDTVFMMRVFCQRRGLSDKNIIFIEN